MKLRNDSLQRALIGFLLMTAGASIAQGNGGAASGAESADGPSPETLAACATCHGASGEGDRTKAAPSLAGMPAWYLDKQAEAFIHGRRKALKDEGGHGEEMVRLLKTMDRAELAKVARHYASLEPIPIESEQGDAQRGGLLYRGRGACINCHLQSGWGAQRSGAPPITILPDWYFIQQMRAFRQGERVVFGKGHGGGSYREHAHGHSHTEEEILRCMIRAASRFDDDDCRDVAAYLQVLARKQELARKQGSAK
ncbi:MAG: c-type cytochrome [Acidobacteriota bacterium]